MWLMLNYFISWQVAQPRTESPLQISFSLQRQVVELVLTESFPYILISFGLFQNATHCS